MKFCDKRIQNHLLNGGEIKRKLGSCNIIMHIGENGFIFDNSGSFYVFCEQDLTSGDWEIVEPEYNWNKIIKDKILCVFGKSMNQYYIVGYLQGINSDGKFELLGGLNYDCCKPFNPADFNIAKDLKEYKK